MEPQRIEVAAGLIFRGEDLLIAQRPEGGHLAGLWEFPGGKREAGETWEDCLVREILEELDVVIRVGELYERIVHDYEDRSVELRFFRCLWESGEPRALGCADWRWVLPSGLRDYPFPAADERLLRRLMREG